jgi:uncharacterized phage protein gp47/JayE
MPILTETQQQFVNDLVASWQARLGLTFSPLASGDPLLAIMQAVATQLVFVQGLVVQVNAIARASTATGADLDSWFADFNFVRQTAVAPSGQVTFTALAVHTTPVTVPTGTIIQTPGGAVQYTVIADTAQAAYSATAGGYVLAAGQTAMTVTVQAVVPGTVSNVQANQLTQMAAIVPGIDLVTNAAGILNGADAETDAAARPRFVRYLAGLSKGTLAAIQSALDGIQQGLSYNILENKNTLNQAQLGMWTTVLDDGSGSPPAGLITAASTALELVRAFTIQQAVMAPTKVVATIVLNVRVASGYTAATVQTAVQNAIVNYVNSVPVGATVYLHKVTQIAIDASNGVVSVQPGSVLLNTVAADLVATATQVIRATTLTVTVGTY